MRVEILPVCRAAEPSAMNDPDRPPAPPSAPVNPGIGPAVRACTPARIGLPRIGASLATAPLLELRLAHARARDAVLEPLDAARLLADLAPLGFSTLAVASAADDRQRYLMRPDLGRRLTPDAADALAREASVFDLVFVIADGLSARAVQKHAAPVLAAALPRLPGWRIAPMIIVRHGRVAVGDAVAAAIGARSVAILIGERPGLSAPDSMGAYLTWQPSAATTDADRNCISNIRPEGLGYVDAATKLTELLSAMRARGLSGVRLKDNERGRAIEQA